MWNFWVWEHPSWRVLASYPSQREGQASGADGADPPSTVCVCEDGSQRDSFLRANCYPAQGQHSGFLTPVSTLETLQ